MINLLFTPVVKRFRERHPDIHLTLREGTGQAVENLVADGELEVGATVLPVAPDHGLAARLRQPSDLGHRPAGRRLGGQDIPAADGPARFPPAGSHG